MAAATVVDRREQRVPFRVSSTSASLTPSGRFLESFDGLLPFPPELIGLQHPARQVVHEARLWRLLTETYDPDSRSLLDDRRA